jgi:hypothetical protein
MSIRATGRLLGVDKDTVNHWLPVLGRHCQGVMNYFLALTQQLRHQPQSSCNLLLNKELWHVMRRGFKQVVASPSYR